MFKLQPNEREIKIGELDITNSFKKHQDRWLITKTFSESCNFTLKLDHSKILDEI